MVNYKAYNLGCTRGACFGKELNAPQNCNSFESGTMIHRTLKLFSSHSTRSFGKSSISFVFIKCLIIHNFEYFTNIFGCIYIFEVLDVFMTDSSLEAA